MNTVAIDAPLEARLTSFAQLYNGSFPEFQIREIEIPIIQRDYAQGRVSRRVERIRTQFIDALCGALQPDADPIELDFIYGDVDTNGTFRPLDGQQRLTTLFLLHCYLAWRMDIKPCELPWSKFSYATRPGARTFCQYLTQCEPELSDMPSKWLKDAAEYLLTWNFDPTIQSMLVVLDALHAWFKNHHVNVKTAWEKITSTEMPAIRFHLLPMSVNGMTDALYIKMNSRGKPLTSFENFKAQFEEMLKTVHPCIAANFALKVDTSWSDIIWNCKSRDQNPEIDDELMRYFRFITEVCAWNSGIDFSASNRTDDLVYLGDLAQKIYGKDDSQSRENLKFLFHAFDVWQGKDISTEFQSLLTDDPKQAATHLFIFHPFKAEGVNLFLACCDHYGTAAWTLAHTLLLYGVLLRLGFPRPATAVDVEANRLRVLRNLIEASDDEIRAGQRNNMPKLLHDVREIIIGNAIDQVTTFNQAQKQNELDKAALLLDCPDLVPAVHALEDHDLLRGGLTAFDLDPLKFTDRARSFDLVFNPSSSVGDTPWLEVTGALLAHGDYSRKRERWTGYHFADLGSPKNPGPWQTLFRGKHGEMPHPMCKPLMALLDAIAEDSTLRAESDRLVRAPHTLKNWQYYLVKYPVMRLGSSGRYVFNASGYEACMLNSEVMRSYYADPYLRAVVDASGVSRSSIANQRWPRDFYGYENELRWLILSSGLKLRSVDAGWEVANIPTEQSQQTAWNMAVNGFSIAENPDGTVLVAVEQNNAIDAVDRIELRAKLLQALVSSGL